MQYGKSDLQMEKVTLYFSEAVKSIVKRGHTMNSLEHWPFPCNGHCVKTLCHFCYQPMFRTALLGEITCDVLSREGGNDLYYCCTPIVPTHSTKLTTQY